MPRRVPQSARRKSTGPRSDEPQHASQAGTDAAQSEREARLRTAAVLLVILALAAVVRIYGIDRNGLWFDELWTLAISAGHGLEAGVPIDTVLDPAPPPPTRLAGAVPVLEVWHATDENVTHPPLYYFLLRIWREIVGEGDVAARMMSVVFSLVAVGLAFDVSRLLYDRAAGLWAAALIAIAAPQVLYAQEARNYTILLALSLAAAGALVRIEKSGPTWPRLAGLCLALLALVLSHYFAVGAALAMGIWALVQLRGRSRWAALGAMAASAVLFLVIWGPAMWRQREAFGVSGEMNAWLYDPNPGRALRAFLEALQAPARLLGATGIVATTIGYAGALLYLLPFVLWRRRPDLRLPGLWLLCTVGVILLLDAARSSLHLEHVRYVLLAGPALSLLLAGLLAPMARWRHAPPAVALAICVALFPGAWSEAEGRAEDWRGAAEYIRRLAGPGDAIVISSEGSVPFFPNLAYLGISHYVGEAPGPVLLSGGVAEPDLAATLRERSGAGRAVWVITAPAPIQPELVVPGARFFELGEFPPNAVVWRGRWATQPGS